MTGKRAVKRRVPEKPPAPLRAPRSDLRAMFHPWASPRRRWRQRELDALDRATRELLARTVPPPREDEPAPRRGTPEASARAHRQRRAAAQKRRPAPEVARGIVLELLAGGAPVEFKVLAAGARARGVNQAQLVEVARGIEVEIQRVRIGDRRVTVWRVAA